MFFKNTTKQTLRACLVSVFENHFLFSRTKKKTSLESGTLILLIVLYIFKVPLFKEQKKVVSLFCILFRVEKNTSLLSVFSIICSSYSYLWFLLQHVYNWECLHQHETNVNSICTNTSLVSIISKYFEVFLLDLVKSRWLC